MGEHVRMVKKSDNSGAGCRSHMIGGDCEVVVSSGKVLADAVN